MGSLYFSVVARGPANKFGLCAGWSYSERSRHCLSFPRIGRREQVLLRWAIAAELERRLHQLVPPARTFASVNQSPGGVGVPEIFGRLGSMPAYSQRSVFSPSSACQW